MGGRKISTILSGDLKLVSSLKEVVPHTEEEIYAMLKECDKDPDETVQRLLKEDKFHVVKRKREKKKENAGTTKNASDFQLANGSGNSGKSRRSSGTSGNQGTGKGNLASRKNTIGQINSRNKVEIELLSSTKSPITASGANLSYSQLVQSRGSSLNKNLLQNKITDSQSEISAKTETWPVGPLSVPSSVLQGAWLDRGTIAEMLKRSCSPDRFKSNSTTQENVHSVLDDSNVEQHSGQHVKPPVMGPDADASLGDCSQSYSNVANEEIIDIRRQSTRYHDNSLPRNTQIKDITISPFSAEEDVIKLPSQPISAIHSESGEHISNSNKNEEYSRRMAVAQSGTEYITISTDQGDRSIETRKDSNGDGPDSQDNLCMISYRLPPTDVGNLPAATLELQKLNLHDEHSAIIPEHIRVCEADCHMLSFGSFNGDFRNLSVGFTTEEAIRFPVSECVTEEGSLASSDSTALSQTSTTTSDTLEQEQSIGSVTLLNNNDLSTESNHATEGVLCEKASNTSHSQGFSKTNIFTSNQEREFAGKTGPLEDSPFDGSTYYSSVILQDTNKDAEYSSFLQGGAFPNMYRSSGHAEASVLNTTSQEYKSSFVVTNGGTISSSNRMGGNTTASTIDFITSAAEAATIEDRSSIPAYATTEQLGLLSGSYSNIFNYQYMLSGLQGPFQSNNMCMGNYRVPSPALGSAGMKYSLPVYSNKMNSKASGGNSMIEGLCYGRGYSSVPARSFPVDSSVTTGNVSSLEDTISQQFKDTSNVQISGQQQMEGSSVWLQNQSSQEGHVKNNLYSIFSPSQNQQLWYAQEQSLWTNDAEHQATLYGHLYHAHLQQQSEASSTAQQSLKQQTFSSLGHAGTKSPPVASDGNLYYAQHPTSNLTLQQQLFQQDQKLGTLHTQSAKTQQRPQAVWPNWNGY